MSSEKLGRNPFEAKSAKAATARASSRTKPGGVQRASAAKRPLSAKGGEKGLSLISLYSRYLQTQALLQRALKTRLDRLSFVRYEQSARGGHLTLLTVGVLNPTVRDTRQFQVSLLKKPIALDLLSLRIQTV